MVQIPPDGEGWVSSSEHVVTDANGGYHLEDSSGETTSNIGKPDANSPAPNETLLAIGNAVEGAVDTTYQIADGACRIGYQIVTSLPNMSAKLGDYWGRGVL